MTRYHAAAAASEAFGRGRTPDEATLWAPVLQELPLFAGVPKRQIRKLAELARLTRFALGSTLVRAGERGDDFFVIIEGKASVLTPDGRAIELGQGDYFGEMSLLDGGPRSATVIAETEVLCLRLSRAPFMKLLRGEPEVTLAILGELTRRIRALQA